MTIVAVNTYTHSVTYVADNILKSMKDIILLSGLDPTNLVDGWASKMRALQTWLASRHLDVVVRSEEHTSELQSLMRISYAVFCLKKKHIDQYKSNITNNTT